MSSDLIGRRRIMQQRLDRVRDLELAMHEQVDIIAARVGKTVEQLDFDGSFRASLAALATLAARRPTFDIVLSLPGAPAGVRVQQAHDEVRVEVVELENEPAAVVITSAAPPGALASSGRGSTVPGTLAQPRPAAPERPSVAPESRPAAPEPRSGQKRPEARPQARPEARPEQPRPENRPQPRPKPRVEVAEEQETTELVVSDLADLLWEGLADPNDGRA